MSNIPKKPDDTIWNDEQWQAIYEKGHDLLISAGAGSGKTAVLVERIIQKILIDHINIDELLVLTFTEAAAAEIPFIPMEIPIAAEEVGKVRSTPIITATIIPINTG